MSKQTAAAFYHAAAVFPRDAGFCFTRGRLRDPQCEIPQIVADDVKNP